MRAIQFYKLSFLILNILSSILVYAQAQDASTIGKVSISSPTAASLGKYGDIPVNYHTGIPQISVPIYTVESGSLKIPISLSYHAGGLKVMESSSWVGAGWSLTAGGMITRTVMGGADDRGYQNYHGYFNSCLKGYYSDYGYQSYLITPGSDSSTYATQLATMDGNFQSGAYDGEPDLYFFNFNGYSGKFYFNDDRTPIIVPQADINIQPDYALGPGFKGFIITSSDGVKYYFGITGNYSSAIDPVESSIPTTISNGPNTASAAASAWYLNKVISADGMDSVTFQYQTESFSTYTWSMFPVTVLNPLTPQQANGIDLVKTITNGIRLTKITFPNGTVVFTPSAAARTDLSSGVYQTMTDLTNTSSYSLGSISISNTNGFCKKDSFYYGYFVDNINTDFHSTFWGSNLDIYNLHTDASRLRLDSVQETTCDRIIKIPPYRFNYFNDFVPRRLSYGVDHWGFYNGVNTNVGLVPTYKMRNVQGVVTQVNGANRDAAWPSMRGGTLQKIVYPTGGSTTLDFESNDTYLNYYNYLLTYQTGGSVGYDGHNGFLGDGGDNPIAVSYSFDGNSYQIVTTNTDNHIAGSYANCTIYDASQNVVYNNGNVNPGETRTDNITLPPGSYSIHIHKESATSGFGAIVSVSEWVPVPQSGNITVGGLRIKTITNYDNVSAQNIATNYTYKVGNLPTGNSTGILYSRPAYVQWVRNAIFELVYGIHPLCDLPTLYLSPSSVRPMATSQGNHMGYNEVFVSQQGNGFSDYQYYGSNVWDYNVNDVCSRFVDATTACAPGSPYLPSAPLPYEIKRGELKFEGQYHQNGSLIRSTYYYPVFSTDSLSTPGHIVGSYSNGITSFTDYLLQTVRKVQTRADETTFGAGNSVTSIKTTYYSSKYHVQPTRTVSNTSTLDSLIENTSYAFDFRPSNFTTPDSLNYFLNKFHNDSSQMYANFNSCPANELQDINNLLNSCHHSRFMLFRGNMAVDRLAFVNYRRRTFTDPVNAYATAHASAKTSAGTELKPIFELQDAFQNPAIENSRWKNTNLLHSNFTRFDYVTTPSGKIYPNKTQMVYLQAPSSTFTYATVSGNTITKDSRYLDESVYKFGSGNPLEVTPRDGITVSYVWDYLNTEPIAKATNITSDQIAYTSFEANGKGGWTFTGAPVTDATAITGSKDYNLSSGNITKSGLSTSKSFVVSYWSKTASAKVNNATTSSLITKNGWSYFEHVLNSGISTITVSGTVTIDELRLYPSDAQMTTYTYTPLLGMTSTCDAQSRITYYFYDNLGRLRSVKDQDGNIVKTIDYHYAINNGGGF